MWPLARVTQVFPGRDGRVRSVEVTIATGQLRRPASKVCLLEETTQEVQSDELQGVGCAPE